MEAIVLDHFGDADALHIATIPVLRPGEGQILVRLDAAGIGSWDPFERIGGYAEMTGQTPAFPHVLGAEGAGTVAAVGPGVDDITVGDVVWATGFLDPDATFYAAGTLVRRDLAAPLPAHLDTVAAAGLGGAATTALRGLEVLDVDEGDTVLIVGASGAVGHVAVQLAKAIGCRVIAAASGDDGITLVSRLGADISVDGRSTRWTELGAHVDAALLLAGGELSEQAAAHADRAAHPTGVAVHSAGSEAFNGEPDRELTVRAASLVASARVGVAVAARYTPTEIARAHTDLDAHHLGKLILDTSQLRW